VKILARIWRGFAYTVGAIVLACLLVQGWYLGWVLYWTAYNPRSSNFMERRLDELRAIQPNASLKHQWADYDRISAHLKRAVVAAEDAKFLDHEGFDWEAIQQAIEKNERRGKVVAAAPPSASSCEPVPVGRPGLVRKGQEAAITLMLETVMSKRRIFSSI
jgi:monofunctional biosynthetic peptidoglycan transglycosylase